MKKLMFVFMIFCSMLFAKTITPYLEIETKGEVLDILVQDGEVIVATSGSSVEIFDVKSYEKIGSIDFPLIEDFKGDKLGAKIYSVDKIENKPIYLINIQTSGAYRELYVVDNGAKKLIIDESKSQMIKKAKFVNENRVLIALMTNELLLLDLNSGKELYRTKINTSHFSDFVFNENKSLVASTDESGDVTILDVSNGKVVKKFSGGNVDNSYKVAFKKNRILTSGQDRRAVVYDYNTGKFDRYTAPFILYACAISPSSNLGAWAFTEQNDIHIFNLNTKQEEYVLKGQKSTMNTIVFISEDELISGSDDKFIMVWRLK